MRKTGVASSFGEEFFSAHLPGAVRSAHLVASALLELINPRSVIDFGCGWGAWLKAFEELGVKDILGIDGDYIDRSKLLIDASRFQAADLCQPILVNRRFEIALCLEVAEHLPKSRAMSLVADLVSVAPVVMFSAAIPRQGGVGQVNEQWPSYWRGLFAHHRYVLVDALRLRLRCERTIEFFYRQNLVLYVDAESLNKFPALAWIAERQVGGAEEWVYAPLYQSALQALERQIGIRPFIHAFALASLRVLRRVAHETLTSGAKSREIANRPAKRTR